MPPENRFELATATWEEAGDLIDGADFVALPCGSTEQHSRHLPLSVDAIRAETLTRRLAEAAPEHGLRIVTLPALPYGYSEHHMNYGGTVTLSASTYQEVIVEVGQSVAEHGAERFLTVNCHGGNEEPLKLAADRLQRRAGLATHTVFWTDYARDRLEEEFGTEWGHAGEYETSVIEHLRPDLVREDRKEPQTTGRRPETHPLRYFDDLTEQGGLGDPTRSDPEFIEEVIAETTDSILERLGEAA